MEVGGSGIPDIWIWDKIRWSQASAISSAGSGSTEFKLYDVSDYFYLSSALAFIYKDAINATGMYVFGGCSDFSNNQSYYFKKITLNDGINYATDSAFQGSLMNLTTTKNSNIISIYFKGCQWYLVLTDEGDEGFTWSELGLWVPPPSVYTFTI